jgi:hypothetical protein
LRYCELSSQTLHVYAARVEITNNRNGNGKTSASRAPEAQVAPAAPDTTDWLTVGQASDRWAVSENTIRTWNRTGKLHSRTAKRTLQSGVVLEVQVYDPRELAALMAARGNPKVAAPGDRGELAARAFELFDEGTPLRRVVIRLRETPATVAELHDQWSELGGAELVVAGAAKAELERFVGPFEDVAGLVERIRATLGRVVEVEVADDGGGRLASASDAEIEGAMLAVLEEGARPT